MTKVIINSESANDSLQISASANEKGIQIFNNQEFGNVRVVMNNGEPLFCLSDVCRVLELSNPTIVAQRLDEDERTKLDLGRQGETIFINESGLYTVVLRSDKPNAKPFRKWVTNEVLPTIRKTGSYSVKQESNSIKEKVEVSILWVDGVSKLLGLNNQSKIALLGKCVEGTGLPLPEYTESKDVLLSATELLKRNNVNLSARVFNAAMIDKGLIERKSRPSKKGVKYFNNLTDKASDYGENQVSPNNPKETQPLYYEHKFLELLSVIGLR